MSRPATTTEQLWWQKLKVLITTMPATMEVQVSAHGNLSAGPSGAVLAALNAGGDAGNAETLSLSTLSRTGFVDASGGL